MNDNMRHVDLKQGLVLNTDSTKEFVEEDEQDCRAADEQMEWRGHDDHPW